MNDAIESRKKIVPANIPAMTIYAAELGGHYVSQADTYETRGAYFPILYAGTLEECFLFVKGHIAL